DSSTTSVFGGSSMTGLGTSIGLGVSMTAGISMRVEEMSMNSVTYIDSGLSLNWISDSSGQCCFSSTSNNPEVTTNRSSDSDADKGQALRFWKVHQEAWRQNLLIGNLSGQGGGR
ncbi:hypothetical protein EC957_002637, partial [Mortierella hygrophila]